MPKKGGAKGLAPKASAPKATASKPPTPKGSAHKGSAAKPPVLQQPKSSGKLSPLPSSPKAYKHTLPHSLKLTKRKDKVEVRVHLPRSCPQSVLDIEANEEGFRLNTGSWGGGYAVHMHWPDEVQGKVRAGEDVEVEATMEGGVLKAFFQVEVDNPVPAYRAASEESRKRRRGENEGAGQPKKKAKTGKQPGKKSQGTEGKKGKKLVEGKDAALKLAESVAEAGEASIDQKLQKAKARDDKIKQINEKRKDRKEAKLAKKEVLMSKIKDEEKAKKAKAKAADAAAVKKPSKDKKRISWGNDEIKDF